MPGPYAYPVGDIYVPCDYWCHRERNPPSTEPGTDYASAYGTTVAAPWGATVHDVKTTNSGAAGRVVYLHLDDGSWCRLLHLSRVDVSPGQHVAQGQRVALSGASGNGDDWYYGAHLHVTWWPASSWVPTPGGTTPSDFEVYVGDTSPPPTPTPTPNPTDEDDEMAFHGASYPRASDGATVYLLFNEASGYWAEHTTGTGGTYNNPLAQNWNTDSWPTITESHAKSIKSRLDAVRRPTPNPVWISVGAGVVVGLLLIAGAVAGAASGVFG